MLIQGTDSYLPIQNNTARSAAARGGRCVQKQDSRYDHISVSAPTEERDFREAVASLSYQVRTCNTTGMIQELHRQVSEGEYRADARETAARMLLLEEGEL